MEKELLRQSDWFHELNKYAEPNNILFVGSTFIHDFPISELEINFQIDDTIYNRGISGLKLHELKSLLDVCIYEIDPAKIILSIGEEDIKTADFDIDNFIAEYVELVAQIRLSLPKCKLYVMGILPTDCKYIEVNKKLQENLNTHNIEYLDFGYHLLNKEQQIDSKYLTAEHVFLPNAYVAILEDLKRFFRNRMMGFGDVINMVEHWY